MVVFGRATAIEPPEEKLAALRAFSEHLIPGRWSEVRPPHPQELEATLVLALPLDEASAKIRTGPPLDDDADYELPVWAGVIPLELAASAPVADPRLAKGIEPPGYARAYARTRQR